MRESKTALPGVSLQCSQLAQKGRSCCVQNACLTGPNQVWLLYYYSEVQMMPPEGK